jgi:hypothetical protein
MLIRKIFSFPTLTLIVALTLSAIAAWYSILGLTAIFAAAVIPIIIMGGALEFAKVVTTLWLHKYWNRAGWNLKLYLIPAVIALAFLTSMGIFGFLSKAHSDQTLVGGDTSAKVELVDEKIKIARENIAMNQKALEQMNSQVDQLLGRTDDDAGANRAVQVRRQQRAERTRLQNEIGTEQETIAKLNEEVAPIRAEIRKIEAEVGPIKYIAALIYGDNPDTNLLERAVRWVIILIVFVFDPLALMLVLAAQSSYKWLDDDLRNRRKEEDAKESEDVPTTRLPQDDVSEFNYGVGETPQSEPIPDAVELETILEEVKEEDEFLDENLDDILHETAYDVPKEDENVSEPIQPNDIPTDDVVREDVPKTPAPDAVPSGDSMAQSEARNELTTDANALTTDAIELTTDVEENEEVSTTELQHDDVNREVKDNEVIATDGVTLQESDSGYVSFEGKSVSKSALQGMRPDLFLQVDSANQSNTNFGSSFPKFAKKGDIFVRVDTLPNRVYKFSGSKWIEINKEQTDSYLYDDEYIKYLINQIELGNYDIDLLAENERLQIEDYLNKTNKI